MSAKPRSAATISRSISQLTPARAPEPSGITLALSSGELEAADVAGEHPEVGEQVVAEVDRLGALQVGVAGHRPVAVGLGEGQQALHRRRRRARSPAASAPGPPSRRRSRPGRCASGRCGACRPAGRSPRRAAARSPCGCPRRPPRTRSRARPIRSRTRSSPASICASSSSVEHADPAAGRGRGRATGRCRRAPAASRRSSERLSRQKRGSGSLRKRRHGRAIMPSAARPRAAASSWQTRSTCASPIAGKNGSASEWAAAASATGNWPSR